MYKDKTMYVVTLLQEIYPVTEIKTQICFFKFVECVHTVFIAVKRFQRTRNFNYIYSGWLEGVSQSIASFKSTQRDQIRSVRNGLFPTLLQEVLISSLSLFGCYANDHSLKVTFFLNPTLTNLTVFNCHWWSATNFFNRLRQFTSLVTCYLPCMVFNR